MEEKMEKFESTSLDIEKENIEKLKQLFPNIVTDGKIDFDMLRTMLGDAIEETREKYQFTWNGKGNAIKIAQSPSTSTLRPVKEKSKEWGTTHNLYIEGDNLEVLKQLQKTYHEKIKFIYIDPPYNTGNDFVYRDDFHNSISNYERQTHQESASNPESNGRFHTDWLNMLFPRLILARNLLHDTGAIAISIDDNELDNLIRICNEIFGESNKIAIVVLENDSRARPYDAIATTHEYIVIYGKTENVTLNFLVNNEKKFSYEDENGGFDLYELRNRNIAFNSTNRPNLYYPFYLNPNNVDKNGLYEISLEPTDNWIEVYPLESNNVKTVWRWGKETAKPALNSVLFGKKSTTGNWQIVKKYREKTYTLNSVWNDKEFSSDRGTLEVKRLFNNNKVFDFPKPVALIKRLIELFTDKDSIILDFFSGSGTTAQAVLQMNSVDGGRRTFILIQLPELVKEKSQAKKMGFNSICEIAEERIRRAEKEIREHEGIFSTSDTCLSQNSGFKIFRLDSSNIEAWDNERELNNEGLMKYSNEVFKEGRSKEDVLYEIMLKYGIFDREFSEIEVNGKTMYQVGKRYMIVCLEDNLTEADIRAIGEKAPNTVVFKESGFKDDNAKINAVYNLEKAGVKDIKCI